MKWAKAYIGALGELGVTVVAGRFGLVAAGDGGGCEEEHEAEDDLGRAHVESSEVA